MALYLWHMIPVVIVAIVGYPAGLLPQPVEGTAEWWLARLEWVVILSLVTVVEMVLLYWGRSFFAAPLAMLGTPLTDRWAEPIMLAGAAMAAYGLAFVAAEGFAPDGHFPWLTGLIFAVGVLLVAPSRRRKPLPATANGRFPTADHVYRPVAGIRSPVDMEVAMSTSEQAQVRTRMFARALGPFFTIVPTTVAVRGSYMRTLFTEFKANPMWPWLFGAILLISGLVIIAFHQYWRSPAAIIVSLVGWFLAIRGVLLLTVPQAYNAAGNAALQLRRNRGDMGGVRLPGLGRAVSDLRRLEAAARSHSAAGSGTVAFRVAS